MLRRLLALLAVLALGCSTMQPGEKLATAAIFADAASTHIGIECGRRELNPLFAWAGDAAPLALLGVNLALDRVIHRALENRDVSAQKWSWRWISRIRFGVTGINAVQIANSGCRPHYGYFR